MPGPKSSTTTRELKSETPSIISSPYIVPATTSFPSSIKSNFTFISVSPIPSSSSTFNSVFPSGSALGEISNNITLISSLFPLIVSEVTPSAATITPVPLILTATITFSPTIVALCILVLPFAGKVPTIYSVSLVTYIPQASVPSGLYFTRNEFVPPLPGLNAFPANSNSVSNAPSR